MLTVGEYGGRGNENGEQGRMGEVPRTEGGGAPQTGRLRQPCKYSIGVHEVLRRRNGGEGDKRERQLKLNLFTICLKRAVGDRQGEEYKQPVCVVGFPPRHGGRRAKLRTLFSQIPCPLTAQPCESGARGAGGGEQYVNVFLGHRHCILDVPEWSGWNT